MPLATSRPRVVTPPAPCASHAVSMMLATNTTASSAKGNARPPASTAAVAAQDASVAGAELARTLYGIAPVRISPVTSHLRLLRRRLDVARLARHDHFGSGTFLAQRSEK